MLASAEELEWNEMSQGYLKCLSRYEKDFLCHVLSFFNFFLMCLQPSAPLGNDPTVCIPPKPQLLDFTCCLCCAKT